jgi:hypothetical protein
MVPAERLEISADKNDSQAVPEIAEMREIAIMSMMICHK